MLAGSSLAQGSQLTLNDILSAEEQQELGFDELTLKQRVGVVRLLERFYQMGFDKGVQQPSGQGRRDSQAPSSSSIETKIYGEFTGWEGETIVKLLNGQVWQQVEYYYHYHYAYMPDVLIYKSGAGYKMKVDGVRRAVGVVRLR